MEYAPRQEKPKTTSKAVVSGKSNPDMLLSNLPYTPATDLSQQFNVVQVESESVLKSQSKEASDSIPEVKESEGSTFKASSQKEPKESEKKQPESANSSSSKPTNHYSFKWTPFDEKAQKAFEEKEQKRRLSKPTNYYSTRPRVSDSALTENQAQNQLEAIGLNTSSIPDRIQVNTNVNLSGEASVENLSAEQNKTGKELQTQKNQASKDIHKDYGENDILKKPSDHELKTTYKFQTVNFTVSPVEDFQVEGIDVSGINSEFKPVIDSNIGAETEKYHSAQSEYDQRVSEEENSSEIRIEEEKNKSKESQLKTVKETQTEVNKSRAEWQKELNKTETDFSQKAGNQAETTMVGIRTEKASGEAAAQSHIDKANSDARREKEKAEREAEEKKSEKKRESKGFFGWVADKASAFINTLKEAVNYIFTKLREAVKAIFEVAKKLVLTVLEAARKAIVILIKSFAVALKGFLDIALAAFPVIRDRFKARIDNFVAASERLVNQVFDLFKKTVTAILDFLAQTVDKLLGIVQSVYDGVLTVIGMIVSGEIGELLKKLGNIKDALFDITFDTIKQGGIEELLGTNLDEPLSVEELMAATQMGLLSDNGEQASYGEMPQAPWTNSNVGVDMVSFEELSPEMQTELRIMQRTGQTEIVLGERNDPNRTMDAVMREANGQQNTTEVSEQKINDGLTPMKRAEIRWEMMKTSIKQWWDNNWLKVVVGIIAALIVFIAAEVVTGGAITAVLPVIMPILAKVFIGIAIIQLANYFADGLGKSWAGDIKGGTKAFSKGLGAALIELAMYLGFKLVEVAGKAIVNLAKAGARMIKTGTKAVMDFAKFIIKQGKVLFKGVAGKNLGKLNKSLRKLGNDILERMQIKKVMFRIQRKQWEVLAEINPLFVIMSGPMPDEEVMSIIKKDKVEVPKGLKKGETFIDKQGRELMKISNLDEFKRTPNYREIFELANKRDISNDVIHHLIEKGSDFAHLFDKEFINAPKSLRAIPKGNINEVLHLSDIKTAWYDVYKLSNQLLKEGGTTSDVKKIILQFANKTDEFISKSLKKIAEQERVLGHPLSKEQISNITIEFKYLLK